MKFSQLNLPDSIQNALLTMGYDEMTPIQSATYPIISSGQDLCALAETGSGKTAACGVPLLQKIDTKKNAIQALIIVPTRELCQQFVTEIGNIAANSDIATFAIFGGFPKEIQAAKLRHLVHILVATPGRLIDFMRDGTVDISHVETVILDEADELLNEGFLDDIKFILSCLLREHQILLFSATMPTEIKKLISQYLKEPANISLIDKQAQPETIEHQFIIVKKEEKIGRLCQYLEEEDIEQGIIFLNSRLEVDRLFHRLKDSLSQLDFIHAGLTQQKRSSLFWQFKRKKIRFLLATDVAGRGLDFSGISHVINVDLPRYPQQYTHRTGRTGRMGKKGIAMSLVHPKEVGFVNKISKEKGFIPLWLGQEPGALKESKKAFRGAKKGLGGRYISKLKGSLTGPKQKKAMPITEKIAEKNEENAKKPRITRRTYSLKAKRD